MILDAILASARRMVCRRGESGKQEAGQEGLVEVQGGDGTSWDTGW